MSNIADIFPEHACSLQLTHNDHLDVYETAETWLVHANRDELYDWKNEEQKQRAIETNEIWTLHWYPNTPIGFNSVAAPTLQELLDYAKEYGNE